MKFPKWVSILFGLKKLKKRFFYHTSRCSYDVIKWVYIPYGIDKTLVPYLKEGYKMSGKRFLKCDGQQDIRIVWDHYNYPEPYFKKLLTGRIESFKPVLKYNEPLKKWFKLSVK